MTNKECVEMARKGNPFEMDGEVFFPKKCVDEFKKNGGACMGVYGILGRDCNCEFKCRVFKGTMGELPADIKANMGKSRVGLMSTTYTIPRDAKVTPY